jgi:hypothetical protein
MRVFALHISAFSLLLLAAIPPIAAQNRNHEAAGELVRQFKAERNPYFQVDVATKLVALWDSSVLPELEALSER